jgi:hypothetical protein
MLLEKLVVILIECLSVVLKIIMFQSPNLGHMLEMLNIIQIDEASIENEKVR